MRHQAILLLIFILCIVPSTYAQDTYNYRPLATEGKVWHYRYDRASNAKSCFLYYSYIIKGDTVINERAYKKLYMQQSRLSIYTAALRDEGCRAYIIPADSTREFCYYDLELEDDMEMAFGLGARPYGSSTTRDSLRVRPWRTRPISTHETYEWVESVGSLQDDFFRCAFWRNPNNELRFTDNLISCLEDGHYIYGNWTPNPSRYEVPLTYENKAGDNRHPSEIWVEWEDGFLTFYGKEVKDEFKIYIDGYDAYSDMTLTGNFCCTYAIERTQTHDFLRMYRIESASEAFSFAASYATLPNGPEEIPSRPFIEEGKVWRTGVTFPNISFSHLYDYYIQGDTIIDNHACKKLMRSELQYPQNYPEHIDTTYAASLYEEGQRVYVVLPGESHLELAYDFASPVGSHIDIDGFNIIVTRKEEKATGCFKGRCTYVGLEEEYEDISFESCWIEGVGVALNPLYSLNELLPTGLLKELLIFCFVNDEVLYYNSDIFDGDIYGLTPQAGEVKKHWIDFTHIKKPRPKAPARERTANETDEENLTGEYSVKQLFVNLKILSGTYAVTLKDAADNVVYHRDVQTSSTIALTTDLTKYPAGTYTLVVENSEEQYTATLTLPLDDTAVRDLPSDQIANNKSSNGKCFDLSGRPLSTPPAKGIYIRDGKKVVR